MYTPHVYLTWGGQSGTTDETWSCGIRLACPQFSDNASLMLARATDAMDDFRDAIAAWHTQALILATGHYVDWIKAQPIASDGKYFPGQYTNE